MAQCVEYTDQNCHWQVKYNNLITSKHSDIRYCGLTGISDTEIKE